MCNGDFCRSATYLFSCFRQVTLSCCSKLAEQRRLDEYCRKISVCVCVQYLESWVQEMFQTSTHLSFKEYLPRCHIAQTTHHLPAKHTAHLHLQCWTPITYLIIQQPVVPSFHSPRETALPQSHSLCLFARQTLFCGTEQHFHHTQSADCMLRWGLSSQRQIQDCNPCSTRFGQLWKRNGNSYAQGFGIVQQ